VQIGSVCRNRVCAMMIPLKELVCSWRIRIVVGARVSKRYRSMVPRDFKWDIVSSR
jgi:hypothetical protein